MSECKEEKSSQDFKLFCKEEIDYNKSNQRSCKKERKNY